MRPLGKESDLAGMDAGPEENLEEHQSSERWSCGKGLTPEDQTSANNQGCQTRFHQGPHQPRGCLQRAECNFRTA